jgi:SagB-type dehydrogenase family enzyme
LERLSHHHVDVEKLLTDAAYATGIPRDQLQILITLTARFQRYAWKYSGKAYAGMLKHVGVVLQTMYLCATAMGLSPCAVGVGDSDCFARAAGLDYYTETSVGEFLLGSRRGTA